MNHIFAFGIQFVLKNHFLCLLYVAKMLYWKLKMLKYMFLEIFNKQNFTNVVKNGLGFTLNKP
jgi:hypothetical protein